MPPSSIRFEPPAADDLPLLLARRAGRLRGLGHVLVLLPVLTAVWAWFGVTGTFPVLICWWRRWPVACTEPWLLDLARVRSARLGPWRTRVELSGARTIDIFHDEIAPADLARLRRTLKAQLAAGRSTSRRSEWPGNRMVSSERGRSSG